MKVYDVEMQESVGKKYIEQVQQKFQRGMKMRQKK